jgi:hypothetical protein
MGCLSLGFFACSGALICSKYPTKVSQIQILRAFKNGPASCPIASKGCDAWGWKVVEECLWGVLANDPDDK